MSIYEIFGLSPGVLSNTSIILEPGTTIVWHDNVSFDNTEVEIPEQLVCDLTKIGPNGRDGGSMSDGIWYVHIIYNPTLAAAGQKAYAVLATHSLDIRGVVFPPGYVWSKRLCIGMPMIGGALLPMHVGNWPQPSIDLYYPYNLAAVTSTSWQLLSLAAVMPNTARLARFRTVLSGAAGNAWLASSSSGDAQRLVHYGSLGVNGGTWQRVTSSMTIAARVASSGMRMDVYLEGWRMTDPA